MCLTMATVEIAEQREDVSSRGLVSFRFISTPPSRFITPSFNPFSLEIKVSSCLCTSFRFPAPLANYSICLLQNNLLHSQLTHDVLISRCISRCLLPSLWNDNIDTSESDFSFAVKKCTSFTPYPASY